MGFMRKRDRKNFKWERSHPLEEMNEITLSNGNIAIHYYFPADSKKTETAPKERK